MGPDGTEDGAPDPNLARKPNIVEEMKNRLLNRCSD